MPALSYPFAWLSAAILLGVVASLVVPLFALVGVVVVLVLALAAVAALGWGVVAALRAVSPVTQRKPVDGYVGLFALATPVEGHPVGTLVQVTVSAPNPSRLVLNFSNHHQALTDGYVLLCGSVGAVKLLELGYTGPLVRRPRLAA